MTSYDNKRIAKLYREVPVEQRNRLQQFRADYPVKKITHEQIEWHYVDTEQGESVLLLLTGAWYGRIQLGHCSAFRAQRSPDLTRISSRFDNGRAHRRNRDDLGAGTS